MPGTDGTGPMGFGPMTGGRRGRCVGDVPAGVPFEGTGSDKGIARGRGGGYGRRNQFYGTGLTGWQRTAHMDATPVQPAAAQADPVARIESTLADVLARLERLQTADRE